MSVATEGVISSPHTRRAIRGIPTHHFCEEGARNGRPTFHARTSRTQRKRVISISAISPQRSGGRPSTFPASSHADENVSPSTHAASRCIGRGVVPSSPSLWAARGLPRHRTCRQVWRGGRPAPHGPAYKAGSSSDRLGNRRYDGDPVAASACRYGDEDAPPPPTYGIPGAVEWGLPHAAQFLGGPRATPAGYLRAGMAASTSPAAPRPAGGEGRGHLQSA